MSQLVEIWRPIPSAPAYEASSLGRVRRGPFVVAMPNGGVCVRTMGPTRGTPDSFSGRFRVTINGRTRRTSTLVCEAFHGPAPDPKHECMHIDEDKFNDRPENLSWGTRTQNMNAPSLISAKRKIMMGNEISPSKITKSDRAQIIASKGTITAAALAAAFGLSTGYVTKLWRRGVTSA